MELTSSFFRMDIIKKPMNRIKNRWLRSRKNPHIPEEIIANILTKLPVKSLGRFRCVSKQWCQLISETKTNGQKLVFITHKKQRYKDKKEDFYTFDNKKRVRKIGKSRQPQTHYGGRNLGFLRFMGSCNGLVLLREGTDLIVWNPTTRYCKYVLNHPRLEMDFWTVSGLCFDSISNSYKVVLSFDHTFRSTPPEITVVGSFKSKSWKEIQVPHKITSQQPGLVLNDRRVHWYHSTGAYYSSPPDYIICFDAWTDEFESLPMPEPVGPNVDRLIGLGVLDGSLCMTRLEEPEKLSGIAQILVMKEYGVKESWTLLFKVEGNCVLHGGGSLQPYFYSENKCEVLMKKHNGRLGNVIVAYDLNTGTTVKTSYYVEDAIVFEETIVRPQEYDGDGDGPRDGRSFIVEKKPSSWSLKRKKPSSLIHCLQFYRCSY